MYMHLIFIFSRLVTRQLTTARTKFSNKTCLPPWTESKRRLFSCSRPHRCCVLILILLQRAKNSSRDLEVGVTVYHHHICTHRHRHISLPQGPLRGYTLHIYNSLHSLIVSIVMYILWYIIQQYLSRYVIYDCIIISIKYIIVTVT